MRSKGRLVTRGPGGVRKFLTSWGVLHGWGEKRRGGEDKQQRLLIGKSRIPKDKKKDTMKGF